MTKRLSGLLLVLPSLAGSLLFWACTTPPIGWQGAGRSQMLPAPEMDATLVTSAGDSGLGAQDQEVDTGIDAGVDAGGGPEPGPADTGVDSTAGDGA